MLDPNNESYMKISEEVRIRENNCKRKLTFVQCMAALESYLNEELDRQSPTIVKRKVHDFVSNYLPNNVRVVGSVSGINSGIVNGLGEIYTVDQLDRQLLDRQLDNQLDNQLDSQLDRQLNRQLDRHLGRQLVDQLDSQLINHSNNELSDADSEDDSQIDSQLDGRIDRRNIDINTANEIVQHIATQIDKQSSNNQI